MTLMTLYIFSWEHGKGWNSWPSLVLRVLPPTCRKRDRFVVGVGVSIGRMVKKPNWMENMMASDGNHSIVKPASA
jgi:hypothetical protein